MTATPNRLLNIILHDSYFKGLRTKLLCDGHTNNTGGNGAGKTSALQLIPIFYGCTPSQIMSRAAGKANFLDYYLPRSQSMIVFEYQRQDGICCAVMYRNQSNQLAYRFIKGSADDTLFCDSKQAEFDEGKSASEILKNLGLQTVSKQYHTSDYAAIIGRTDKSRRDVDLVRDANRFGLCSTGTKMQFMGDLTNVLQSENQLLKKLKTMLAETLLSGAKIAKTPVHTQNESLLDTFEMLSKLEQTPADIEKGKGLLDGIRHDREQLATYRQNFYHLNDKFTAEKSAINGQKEKNEQQKELAIEEHGNKSGEILGKIKEIEIVLKSRKTQLTKIIEKQSYYKTSKIDDKISQFDKLDQHKAELKNLQEDLNFLNHSAEEIIKQHQAQALAIQTDYSEQVETINRQISEQHNQYTQANEAITLETQQLSEQEKAERKKLGEQHTVQKDQLKEQIHEHKIALVKAEQPTEHEQAELRQFDDQYQQLQSNLSAFAQDQADNAKTKQTILSTLATLEQEYQALGKTLATYQVDKQQLTEILYGDGTLLAFLRGSNTDWQNVAKVINPDLLLAKNLQPNWGEPSDNIFGLQLDTEAIALPKQAEDETVLQEQLELINKKIEQISSQQNFKQKQVFIEQDKLKQCQNDETIFQSNIDEINRQISVLNQAISDKKNQFKHNAEKRKLAIADDIERLHAKLAQLSSAQQVEFNDFERQYQQKHDQIKQRKTELDQDFTTTKQGYDISKTELEEQRQRRINQLNFAKEQALSEKGIDNNKIATAEKAVRDKLVIIKAIESYYAEIQAYQYWLDNEFNQKDDLENDILTDELNIKALDTQKQVLNRDFELAKRRFEENDDHFVKQLHELENKLLIISDFNQRIAQSLADQTVTDNGDNQSVSENLPYEVLTKLTEEKLQALTQAIADTIKIAKTSRSALTGKLEESWQLRMQKYRHEEFSANYYLSTVRELVDMMTHEIPVQKSASLQTFRTLSQAMKEYYEQLNAFNSKVNRKSKEISKEINNNHGFTALDEINISLTSVLHKYGHDDLRKFVKQYDDEIGIGDLVALPSTQLTALFRQAILWLENSKLDTEHIASLIELNISYKENGREVVVRHDEDLLKGSSTGLSILLIVVIFASLTRYLCSDEDTVIHWSIDEIGKLDDGNIKKLFAFMDKQKVQLFCAQPNANPVLNKLFVHKNDINRNIGVRHYVTKPKTINPAIEKALQLPSSNITYSHQATNSQTSNSHE